jgi:hypothetical protein
MIFSVKMKNKGHQRKCGYCICGDAQVVNKSASLFFKCGTIRIKIMGPFILTTHIKMTETSLTSSWINFTRGIASKATLQQYSHSVRHYMTFLKVKDPDDLLMLDKKLNIQQGALSDFEKYLEMLEPLKTHNRIRTSRVESSMVMLLS